MANKIIPCSFEGKQKSVSIDKVLFQLLAAYHSNNETVALSMVRHHIKAHWGKTGLSKLVQHEILKTVCKPNLVSQVFKTDKHSQTDMEV